MPTRSSHTTKHSRKTKVNASKASHTAQFARTSSGKHSKSMQRLASADVSLLPFNSSDGTDTEQCFLPLLLLLGLWGGARGLRGARQGFGFGGGGFGGPGAGMGMGLPGASFGTGGPWGGRWGGPWGGFGMPGGSNASPFGGAGPGSGLGAGGFGGFGGLGGMFGGRRSPFWF